MWLIAQSISPHLFVTPQIFFNIFDHHPYAVRNLKRWGIVSCSPYFSTDIPHIVFEKLEYRSKMRSISWLSFEKTHSSEQATTWELLPYSYQIKSHVFPEEQQFNDFVNNPKSHMLSAECRFQEYPPNKPLCGGTHKISSIAWRWGFRSIWVTMSNSLLLGSNVFKFQMNRCMPEQVW